MNGIVRKKVPIVGAIVTVAYQDGAQAKFRLKSDEFTMLFRDAGYHIPQRYREERDVRCLTLQELYEALCLYEAGCSWDEIAECYLVPADELRSIMRKRDQERYRRAEVARRMKRDIALWKLRCTGLTQTQVAQRMEVTRSMVGRACERCENGYYEGLLVELD